MSSFQGRLSELRKKRVLSQTTLSEKFKVARSTVAMWETGDRHPDYETLDKIADFFDVSVDYLLGRTDDPSPSRPLHEKEKSTTYNIAGKDINLSEEELSVLAEMKKHPKFAAMFHDLATNPEKKVKTLIKMWEVIKADLDEDDDRDDIIED